MRVLKPKRDKTTVGVDVEAGSVAATEVRVNGRTEVLRHGVVPLDPGVFREGEVMDPDALGAAFKQLVSEYDLSKDVRVGVANQRIAVRTLYLPPIEDPEALEQAIRFQAQDEIPMPLEQAVLDWEVIGHTTTPDGDKRVEVVAVAARRDMLAPLIEAMHHANLRPVGVDLSAFGMIRALAPAAPTGPIGDPPAMAGSYEQRFGAPDGAPGVPEPAVEYQPTPAGPQAPTVLYASLGDVLNLAVAQGSFCRFTRISPFGIEGIAQRLAERRRLTLDHARQWLVHVGLAVPTSEIEGDPQIVTAAREALDEGVSKLVDEMRLSLEFYGSQPGALPIESVIACGPGTTIPGLADQLQRAVAYPLSIGRPAGLSGLEPAAAARLTLSYGLALED